VGLRATFEASHQTTAEHEKNTVQKNIKQGSQVLLRVRKALQRASWNITWD